MDGTALGFLPRESKRSRQPRRQPSTAERAPVGPTTFSSAMINGLRDALTMIVGNENVLTAPEDTYPYGQDGTPLLRAEPGAVVFARSAQEVSAVLRFANAAGIPVVTRGSGTGLSGGSVPVKDGIVLCLARMDAILEVDASNLTLRAQAGAITSKIAEAAEQRGLFYPPDPGSLRISTIGGNVAENAGGLRGLKYGVTRDYIMGIQVVLADGDVVWFGNKCVKDAAGFTMRDLFIGSEGCLGVVTEVLLRLLPKPAAKRTLLATFQSIEDAAAAASSIIAHPIVPCTLEYLDEVVVRCVEEHAKIGLPQDARAILLVECDGHPVAVEEEAAQVAAITRRHQARTVRLARSDAEADQLSSARRAAFAALARRSPTILLEDVTVPRSELAKMVRRIREIAGTHRLTIGTFGHFGDGNLHPTILADERDADVMRRAELAVGEIFEAALEVGGTITGEHGVGLTKKAWLERSVGVTQVQLMRRFKRALDPRNILNPGKIFD